jgi:hypothetical protein
MSDFTMFEGDVVEQDEVPAMQPAEAAGDSLRDSLRAARARAQHRTTGEFPIPGYEGRLHGEFRALDDYSEVRAIVMRHTKVADVAQQELYVAADTLLAASVGTFAMQDGVRHDLSLPLGRGLAAYLGYEGLESDRQALFAVFPATISVMTLFAEYDLWMKASGVTVDEDLAGN